MVCSCCGWLPCKKKGEFGTAHVVQHMFDKAFGSDSKDTATDAAAVAEDDAAVMGEQQRDGDPMDELDELLTGRTPTRNRGETNSPHAEEKNRRGRW